MDHIQNIIDKLQQMFHYLVFFSCFIDLGLIGDLRHFLLDFLIGQRNRKRATKIHQAQSLKDRILMGYILGHLTRYQKDFKIYHGIYLGVLYSCIPQCFISVLCYFWNGRIGTYVVCTFIIMKLLLAIYMRCQVDSSPAHRSVYRRGK